MVLRILWTAHLGGALGASITAETGWESIQSPGVFLSTVIVCLMVRWVTVYLPALDAAGIPAADLAILFRIDGIPARFRSAVNITGHMVGAAVVEEPAFRRTGPGESRAGEAPGNQK